MDRHFLDALGLGPQTPTALAAGLGVGGWLAFAELRGVGRWSPALVNPRCPSGVGV